MSPETIISDKRSSHITPDYVLSAPKSVEHSSDDILAASGVHFKNDEVGVLPRIINEIYTKRVGLKEQMIASQKELEELEAKLMSLKE